MGGGDCFNDILIGRGENEGRKVRTRRKNSSNQDSEFEKKIS